MSTKYIFITSDEWFETTALSNPINTLDDKLEKEYPEYFSVNYDLRVLATNVPAEEEKSFPFYNDYRDKYGSTDISVLKEAAKTSPSKNIFLNGFNQECFDYIAPYIKDTAEIIYLYKCRSIKDLSVLSGFPNLKCLHIFGNNSIKELWSMKNNNKLKIISFIYITNLQWINRLSQSKVEYFTLDSMDIGGNVKDCTIDDIKNIDEIPNLKHLKLVFADYNIDY